MEELNISNPNELFLKLEKARDRVYSNLLKKIESPFVLTTVLTTYSSTNYVLQCSLQYSTHYTTVSNRSIGLTTINEPNRSIMMDMLPYDIYEKIMKLYFHNSIFPELLNKLNSTRENMYSVKRLQIVAERGAYTGIVLSCQNCLHFGLPCNNCNKCVWNIKLYNMKAHMYTCLQNPSHNVSVFRSAYMADLANNDVDKPVRNRHVFQF